MKTVSLKVRSFAGGTQYSEEDKAAYQAKWEKYATLFAKTPQGGKRSLRGRVLKITGPIKKDDKFNPGTKKKVFELECELRHPGVEGLKFNQDVTASLNEKATFQHLYVSVVGENPDESGEYMDLEPGIVTCRDVNFVIKKGKPRDDKKRGGFSSNISDFEPIYDDEGELKYPLEPMAEGAWVPGPEDDEDDVEVLAPAEALVSQFVREHGLGDIFDEE